MKIYLTVSLAQMDFMMIAKMVKMSNVHSARLVVSCANLLQSVRNATLDIPLLIVFVSNSAVLLVLSVMLPTLPCVHNVKMDINLLIKIVSLIMTAQNALLVLKVFSFKALQHVNLVIFQTIVLIAPLLIFPAVHSVILVTISLLVAILVQLVKLDVIFASQNNSTQ